MMITKFKEHILERGTIKDYSRFVGLHYVQMVLWANGKRKPSLSTCLKLMEKDRDLTFDMLRPDLINLNKKASMGRE